MAYSMFSCYEFEQRPCPSSYYIEIDMLVSKLILRGGEREAFLSPEAAFLLVSTKNRDLWEGPIF